MTHKTTPWVDCQTHVFPKAYAELFKQSRNSVRVSGQCGKYLIDYGELQQFNLDVDQYDPARKLRQMDEAGIDVGVLSVNIPGPECLEPELGVPAAALCNDYLAELCARNAGRFIGLASLPLQDVPSAIAELERAVRDLGLRGALLVSHVCGKPLDAPEFEPLYRCAEALGVPLVLHPTVPSWGQAIQDYAMIPMFGFMVDTSIAMLRLILSGIMERYPRLTIVHPHVGGVLPYLMGRVQEQTEVKRRGRDNITAPPAETYRRVYLDLVSPSLLAMRYAYDFAGADRLLFGSDEPWVSVKVFLDLVGQLDMPETDRQKLLGLNACELFRIT
jgi:predicted TIM-barrel fold metal-dependent hydrolase